MALPIFFHATLADAGKELWLDEDTAKHIVQVLRMQAGAGLVLTDGKGTEAKTIIVQADKKKCRVLIEYVTIHQPGKFVFHLGIAFTKNTSRNEWLLEKATELGARSIIPLITKRTEKEKTRYDRWTSILTSAMLQSQQYHLPILSESRTLDKALAAYGGVEQKLIAHCIAEKTRQPLTEMLKPGKETILLIGPEGDFTEDEVTLCEAQQYAGISLGNQRLRTETAAMAACAYFNLINNA